MATTNKSQLLRTISTIVLAVSFLFYFIGYTSSYWYLFESRGTPRENSPKASVIHGDIENLGYLRNRGHMTSRDQKSNRAPINNSNECRPGSVQHIGLWEYCEKALSCTDLCYEDYCQSIDNKLKSIEKKLQSVSKKPAKFEGARVYASFAIISCSVGIVLALVTIVCTKECIILHPIIGFFAIAAGCLSLLAVILFGTICSIDVLYDNGVGNQLHQIKSSNFHFSFAFYILGAIASLISGILYIVVWRRLLTEESG